MRQVLRQVIRFCIATDVRKQTLDEHPPLYTGIVYAEKMETFGYVPHKMPQVKSYQFGTYVYGSCLMVLVIGPFHDIFLNSTLPSIT